MDASASPLLAYILCGGQGTRLRSVIGETQKTVAEIHGEPFLALLLRELKKAGAGEAVLCAGYRADQLLAMRHELAAQTGVALEIVVETEPLGTGGALLNGLDRHAPPSRYLVLNADTFLEASAYRQLWQSVHPAVMLAARVDDRARFGGIECDEEGRVLRLMEKGLAGPGLINGGAYLFSADSLAGWPLRPSSLERDILPALIERQAIWTVAYSGNFID
ncbi:MAG: NTP transferase domain-containing protein, partial [Zoogloeaceae bacterium]|nr:NTP transferase domain-containing protein [Zoogloeaceae bacterium]